MEHVAKFSKNVVVKGIKSKTIQESILEQLQLRNRSPFVEYKVKQDLTNIKNSLSPYAAITSSRGGFFIIIIESERSNFLINSYISDWYPKSTPINQELARENARLKKQLIQAHAIIEIQKKVSE